MKRWINKVKRRLIHKLGGYTSDEATPNRKIERLTVWHRYSTACACYSLGEVHLRERDKALKEFVSCLEPYIKIEERRDYETDEWILRLSLRVVDEHLL